MIQSQIKSTPNEAIDTAQATEQSRCQKMLLDIVIDACLVPYSRTRDAIRTESGTQAALLVMQWALAISARDVARQIRLINVLKSIIGNSQRCRQLLSGEDTIGSRIFASLLRLVRWTDYDLECKALVNTVLVKLLPNEMYVSICFWLVCG